MKFTIALLFALCWAGVSCYFDQTWLSELASHIGLPLALIVIIGVAIIPGFMNSFLLASLLLDKRIKRKSLAQYPPITILMAAYNEASSIAETIASIERQ